MQMDCPTEEGLLRKKLGGMPGVTSLEFNLMQRVLTVTHAPNEIEPILAAVRSLGFTPEIANSTFAQGEPTPEPAKPWWPLALAGAAAIASEAVEWTGLPTWMAAALALVAVLACGITTYKKGWIAIRNGNLAKCAHPPKIGHFVKLVPIARRLALSSRFQVHVDMHR